MSVQPVNQSSRGVGFSLRQVIVEEIIPASGLAICQEVSTKHRQDVPLIPLRVRTPRVGEVWMIDQTFGHWSFAALIRATDTAPVVAGARAGVDPLTLSLLAALVAAGVVHDSTV